MRIACTEALIGIAVLGGSNAAIARFASLDRRRSGASSGDTRRRSKTAATPASKRIRCGPDACRSQTAELAPGACR
jgi:hypothetical protein